jgi:hypothetical protein
MRLQRKLHKQHFEDNMTIRTNVSLEDQLTQLLTSCHDCGSVTK